MLDLIKENWAIIWALGSTIASVVMCLLAKTYAKKEDITKINVEVAAIKQRVDMMPSKRDFHQLQLDIANLRGDLKEISPQIKQVRHVSDLLLSHELREKRQ